MFDQNTRIAKITGAKEFKGYEYMTGKFPGIGGVFSGFLPVKTLAKMVGWNAESIVDGWNYLSEKAGKQKVFYDIYTDSEKAEDPSKKLTGIAAFPLEKKSKFCIVCAGGGYSSVCSFVEAYPIIHELNKAGYAAFSLQYRCGKDAKAPNPQQDLARAVSFILAHAEEFSIETENYAVMGFSAGGHLAACFAAEKTGYAKYHLPAPGCMILCYPVITMGEKTHAGSRRNLLGKNPDEAMIDQYSVEKNVTVNYPDSFIWQFDHDNMVPCDNSKMMADELEKNHVRHQYVTYPGTIHGAGLGADTPAQGWLEQALAFWNGCRK